MATTQDLINALIRGGYSTIDATNAANGSNAANLANEYLKSSITSNLPASTVKQGAISNAPLPKAPAGGFQQGGWYNGRQYWNGTFSQPGQIHPESNQQGAGQMVSPEVLASTSVAAGKAPGANQNYINSQYNNPTSGTGTSSTVNTTGFSGSSSTGTGTGTGVGVTPAKTINLMEEQKKLYDSSGISQIQTNINNIQAVIDAKKAEADKRRSEVNENPFLSESSRVGRIAKIDQALNDTLKTDELRLNSLQNQVTEKKAEINEKLGLVKSQFDIDRVTRQDNIALFNSLLSSGALRNATEQDLGNLSAQTGLPMSFIQSAIQTSIKKNVQIEVQTDNNGNVSIISIDKDTGDIINTKSAGKIGKAEKPAGTTDAQLKQAYKEDAISTARTGTTLEQMFSIYTGYLDPNDIYTIYNSNSSWGVAGSDWTPEKLALYGVKTGSSGTNVVVNIPKK